MQWTPSSLGIVLDRIKPFQNVQHKLEQYATPSQLAAQVLLWAQDDMKTKHVVDLGAGTGRLALGATLFAHHVTVVDIDEHAIALLKQNYDALAVTQQVCALDILQGDVMQLGLPKADCVVMNPPFGTKTKGIDVQFIEKALSCAPIVWSMHKTSTKDHLYKVVASLDAEVTFEKDVQFAIPQTHEKHKRKKMDVDVTVFCFEKKK